MFELTFASTSQLGLKDKKQFTVFANLHGSSALIGPHNF